MLLLIGISNGICKNDQVTDGAIGCEFGEFERTFRLCRYWKCLDFRKEQRMWIIDIEFSDSFVIGCAFSCDLYD
jgi:hypothetical protein